MPKPAHTHQAKTRLTFTKAAGLTLTLLGLTALTIAVIYSSSIPAFIGLGLTFWGIIITIIETKDYVKNTILDATTTSTLTLLNQTLQELDYKGKAIYLPPKYLNDPESLKVYIPKSKTGKLPTPEQTQELETRLSPRTAQGLLLTPPGADLTKLFEQTLSTDFARTNLDYIQQNLPKLLIEDLEIATEVETQIGQSETPARIEPDVKLVRIKHDRLLVKITSPIYKAISSQAKELPYIYSNIGCPLTSAIACAIAKATGKPAIIENQQTDNDGQTTETEYRLLEGEQQ